MQQFYHVPQLSGKQKIEVEVPGSKSITNRALMLAALSSTACTLKGVLFSDDSRAFLQCLQTLGFRVEIEEEQKRVMIQGTGGQIPNRDATINVRSAGTAARFLTVMLAMAGGNYRLESSAQMERRPMEPLLSVLREMGAEITCLKEEGHFPFLISAGQIQKKEVTIDTDVSSQFASALLMAGIMLAEGLMVHLKGGRTNGAYIQMTLRMMEQFGIEVNRVNTTCIVPAASDFGVRIYQIEPDVSGACYFYAMAPLLRMDVLVKNVYQDSMQGDLQFLTLLEQMGCVREHTAAGILIRGSHLTSFPGVNCDMKNFSDQTMTVAVLAPFADTETEIHNVGHIRLQESDRIEAILTELKRLGIKCEAIEEGTGIRIEPGTIKGGIVETYEDHRMAMSFALIGLKTGNIIIHNPDCCKKTFENYFKILDMLRRCAC